MADLKNRLKVLELSRRVKTAKPYKVIRYDDSLSTDEADAKQARERAAAEADGFNTICTRLAEPVRTGATAQAVSGNGCG